MPVPNPEVQRAGVWSPYDLPSEPQCRVLMHLNESGEPRLQLVITPPRATGRKELHEPRKFWSTHHGRLTNSEHKNGWTTQVDLRRFVSAGWIERRKEEEERTLPEHKRALGLSIWAITDKGREATAQFFARKVIKKRMTQFLIEILNEARREAKAPVKLLPLKK